MFLGPLITLAILSAEPSNAAVIYSSCPVSATNSTSEVDRYPLSTTRSTLRNYSSDLTQLARYITWLTSGSRQVSAETDEQMIITGKMIEDTQLAVALTSKKPACHSDGGPTTQAKAIFPFVLKASGPPYKVRYKLCDYYVDEKRQIPFEDACTVIGRETGYTFPELEKRFATFRTDVDKTKQTIEFAAYGVGAVGSIGVMKFFRVLRLGSLPTMVAGVIPIGGSYYAVQSGLTDEFARNLVDMKGAGEVAVTGDLATSVAVSMPIQDFVPFFERYLRAIPELTAEGRNIYEGDDHGK